MPDQPNFVAPPQADQPENKPTQAENIQNNNAVSESGNFNLPPADNQLIDNQSNKQFASDSASPKMEENNRPAIPAPIFHSHKISPKKSNLSEPIFHIEVEKIKPNPHQPRQDFNEES